jgi:biopolymer transport protein TolQ
MNGEMSLIGLVWQASWLVKLVLLILLWASVGSWVVIIQKSRLFNRADAEADEFEERFWSGTDLTSLYESISEGSSTGLEAMFETGFREFGRLRQRAGVDPAVQVEGARRGMRVAMTRELDRLEAQLPFLATVGSTSPYVGLFGTVWGIMNSFRALGNVNQATLAMVAPGIAEALIATAMGLFAAIPAVVGYNRLISRDERIAVRYETFVEEFAAILQRQAYHAD